jgi:hypothetical protein
MVCMHCDYSHELIRINTNSWHISSHGFSYEAEQQNVLLLFKISCHMNSIVVEQFMLLI